MPLFLASVLTAQLLSAAADPSEILEHERYTLDNGLDVILHVDRSLPLVAVDLSYHVGQIHDGAHPGLAHLTEHLMFRGTKDIDDGEHTALLAEAGALHNATTHLDRTSYHTVVPSNQLPLVLWLEVNRMSHMLPALDRTTVREEVQTTIDEWRHRLSSRRLGDVVIELNARVAPTGHPWAFASPDKIEQLTIEDVREFVRRHHGPENATLVLAGDLPADIREQIARHFGSCEGGDRPALPDLTLSAQLQERRVVLESEYATNPVLVSVWPSAPIFAAGDAEADILARVLAVEVEALADEQSPGRVLAVEAHQSSRLGLSQFVVGIEGSSSTTPEELLAILDAALAHLRSQPISLEAIDRAKRRMQLGTFNSLQSLESRANRMHIYVTAGKPADWLDEDLARYDPITPDALADLLDHTLVTERRTVVLANPAAVTEGTP